VLRQAARGAGYLSRDDVEPLAEVSRAYVGVLRKEIVDALVQVDHPALSA
jgi:hypothetical protein